MNPRTTGPTHITGLAVTVAALALLALWAVVSDPGAASPRVGWLLAMAAMVEGLHAQRRGRFDDRRRATGSAIISLLIALALINASALVAGVLRYLVAAWFALDAVQAAAAALRGTSQRASGPSGWLRQGRAR